MRATVSCLLLELVNEHALGRMNGSKAWKNLQAGFLQVKHSSFKISHSYELSIHLASSDKFNLQFVSS